MLINGRLTRFQVIASQLNNISNYFVIKVSIISANCHLCQLPSFHLTIYIFLGAMDHVYAKVTERCPSVFRPSVSRSNDDHTYTAQSIIPKKLETSKRQRGTPTGKTPNQPSKMSKPAHVSVLLSQF